MNKIETCKKCTNRKFDRNKGIVCGLTGAKPTFEATCLDFKIDESIDKIDTKLIRPNYQRAKTAILLVGFILILDLISLVSDFFEYKLLKLAQIGELITEEMVNSNDTRQQIVGIFYLIVYFISVITFIQWFRRAYYNLHQRIKYCSQSEGWATGSWFVPIICLYKPYQIMKEMWKETTGLLVNKIENYTNNYNISVIGWWWTLWIISSYVGNFVMKSTFKSETVDELINSSIASMILSLIGIPLALLTIKMIKDYSIMEQTLMDKELEINN
ncbi:MAG: DUF4328 domain-containing protein [Bacteroidales bacterium]|nr:DUF4328 domain-containing protein [Bacteroidales bacterium]